MILPHSDEKMLKLNEENFEDCFIAENSEFAEDEITFEESMSSWFAGICWGAEKLLSNFRGKADVPITEAFELYLRSHFFGIKQNHATKKMLSYCHL